MPQSRTVRIKEKSGTTMLVGTGQLGNDFDREIRNLLLTEGRKLYGLFSVDAVDADFGFPINCAMI